MYESFYGLNRRPFSTTPDPQSYVPLKAQQDVLDDLMLCVRGGQGIGILTGPAGTGKTQLCRKLLAALDGRFKGVFLATANFPAPRSLLQAVLYELDQPYLRMAEQELRLQLTTAVKALRPKSEGLLLVVDEAHLLGTRLLEELRVATNIAADGTPLVRLVLSGQMPLEEKLAGPGLEAFNQRIRCQASLEPLTRRESAEYIARRLELSGGEVSEIFTPKAVETICHASDGLPRCLNQLADHSLLLGYLSRQQPVGVEIVYQALEDLKQLPLHWNDLAPVRAAIALVDGDLPNVSQSPAVAEPSLVSTWNKPASAAEASDVEEVAVVEIGGGDDELAEIQLFAENTAETEAVLVPTKTGSAIKEDLSWVAVAERNSGFQPVAETVRLEAAAPSRERESRHGAGRVFEEEVVVDRYAMLDAGRALPALLEESRIEPRAAGAGPTGSSRPQAPVINPAASDRFAMDADSQLVGNAAGGDEELAELPDVAELDEQIESAMLDLCLETHQTITAGLPNITQLLGGELDAEASAPLQTATGGEGIDPWDPGFDIVEPEPAESDEPWFVDEPAATAPQTPGRDAVSPRSPESGVSSPQLQQLFTRLRRQQRD
jgi:type II secretory pathway predicted ATPase ExeA